MPRHPLTSWKAVVQKLQQLPAQGCCDSRLTAAAILDLFFTLNNCGSVTRAHWKDLISEQVRQLSPKSGSTGVVHGVGYCLCCCLGRTLLT
jgi:hypothetical protein